MTNINLTCNAYATGDFYRLPTEDGKPSTEAMRGTWYQADAADAEGAEYIVFWAINPDWDGADEADACSWEHPTAVVRIAPWADVTNSVAITD